MEIKIIPEHPLYGVAACGRVFSKAPRGVSRSASSAWHELKVSPCAGGNYLMFGALKGVKIMVHRAVAMAFIGPIPPGHHVAHLNGDSLDNRLENLSIVTPKENNYHKKLHGTQLSGSTMKGAKLNEARVFVIRKILARRNMPAWRLAELYGISQSLISNVRHGKRWS
jgi:hypothetical protein